MSGSALVPRLLEHLVSRHGFESIDASSVDAFVARPGAGLLVFTADPVRYRETLDLAVIAPELVRALPGRFASVGVVLPDSAQAVHGRFAFRRWPALVIVRDGAYIGAIDGLREWSEYLSAIDALLQATKPAHAPIAIPVRVESAASQGGKP